jgi:hypothetical protein
MLTLTGTIRSVVTLGGGVNKKTGEVIPLRPVLQVEGLDSRGLFQMFTLTVPDIEKYKEKINQKINVPVRAWVPGGGAVHLSFDDTK